LRKSCFQSEISPSAPVEAPPVNDPTHPFRTFVCTNCGHSHAAPLYCGNRFCDVCGKFRRFKSRERMKYILHHVDRRPGFFWRHITLTIPNQTDAGQGVKLLYASFRKLRQQKWWKSHCTAGMFTVEITGHPGNWHPHLHILVYSRWIPFTFLRTRWNQVSTIGDHVYLTQPKFSVVLGHLVKYINDPGSDLSLALWRDDSFLRGLRLYQSFGKIPKVPASVTYPKRPCEKCGAVGAWCPEELLGKRGFPSLISLVGMPLATDFPSSVINKIRQSLPSSVVNLYLSHVS